MNPDTGHLVSDKRFEKMVGDIRKGYEPLPEKLHCAARLKLAGREEAHISLSSGGKLSKWAAGRRKAKRKMQKASRRRNRA